jgi:hypothetical protein
VVVAIAWGVVVAIGRAKVPRVVVPAPTTNHTVRAAIRPWHLKIIPDFYIWTKISHMTDDAFNTLDCFWIIIKIFTG